MDSKSKKRLMMISGIGISSLAFLSIHVNYYNFPQMMLSVFISGIWLGALYWKFEDLTSLILAHFILNFIYVWSSGLAFEVILGG